MRAGSDVVVVSSGAVGAGLAPLGLTHRPRDLATKQAAASVGQLALAHAWGTSFARYGRTVGQVLLTADDHRPPYPAPQRAAHPRPTAGPARGRDRQRERHGRDDGTAVRRQRSARGTRRAPVGADALVLLSDVDGLYDGDPRKGGATLIPEVNSPEDLDGVGRRSGGALGTGGMASKLSAARLAADSGVPVLLTAAADAADGTHHRRRRHRVRGRPHRMSPAVLGQARCGHAGALHLDAGAVRAVVERRRSLLPAGITAVGGRFYGGDVVVHRRTRRPSRRARRGGVRLDGDRGYARPLDHGPSPPTCIVPSCTPTTWGLCSRPFSRAARTRATRARPSSRPRS